MTDDNQDNGFDDGSATAEAYEVDDLSEQETPEDQDQETKRGENTGIYEWVNGELVLVGSQAEDALSTIVNMQEQLEKRKKHIQEVKEEIDRLNEQLPEKIAERRRYSKERADTETEIYLAEQRIKQLDEKEADYSKRGESVAVKLEALAEKYDVQRVELDKKKETVMGQIDTKIESSEKRIESLEKALEQARESLRILEEKKKNVNDATKRRADAIQNSYDSEEGELKKDYENIIAKSRETEAERTAEEEKYSGLKEKYQSAEDNCEKTDESIAQIKERIKNLAKDITNSSVTSLLRSSTPESLALPSLELDYESADQEPEILTDEDISPENMPQAYSPTSPTESEELDVPDLSDEDIRSADEIPSQFSRPPYSTDNDPEKAAERREHAQRLSNELGIDDPMHKKLEAKDISKKSEEPDMPEGKYTPSQMNDILNNLTQPAGLGACEKPEIEPTEEIPGTEDSDINGILDELDEMGKELNTPTTVNDKGSLEAQMVKEVLGDPSEEVIPVSEAKIVLSSIDLLSSEIWQVETDGPIRTCKIQYIKGDESKGQIEYVDTNMFMNMMSSNAYRMLAGIKEDLPGEQKTKFTLEEIENLSQISDEFASGWTNLKGMVERLLETYNPELNELINQYSSTPEADTENIDLQDSSHIMVCDRHLQTILRDEVFPTILNEDYLAMFSFGQIPETYERETIFYEEIDVNRLVESLDNARKYLEENAAGAREAVQKGGEGIEYVLQQKGYDLIPVETSQGSD